MFKKLILPSKILIALGFILLFYHRVTELKTAYLKFALIDFIYENNLQFLFYVLTALEIIIAFGIFFVYKRYISVVVDIAFACYILFLGWHFMVLLKKSDSCIECNYTTHFYNENIKVTLFIILGMFILYALFVRGSRYSKTARISPLS